MIITKPKPIETPTPKTVQEIAEIRNKILIYRAWGGLGDIINTRPLFKTIKLLNPDLHVTYAAPKKYHDALSDHPYIDELIDVSEADPSRYGYSADISSDCGDYEGAHKPIVKKHRSDIWAEVSLGMTLVDHDFQMRLDEVVRSRIMEKYSIDDRDVAIFPKSASESKDLQKETVVRLSSLLEQDGFRMIVVNTDDEYEKIGLRSIHGLGIRDFIHLVSCFRRCVSVDTGAFHLTAALGIPCVGIFPWTDGQTLAKYHPRAVVLQNGRDSGGPEECPCWDWPMCPFGGIPLKCITSISAEMILEGVKKL